VKQKVEMLEYLILWWSTGRKQEPNHKCFERKGMIRFWKLSS